MEKGTRSIYQNNDKSMSVTIPGTTGEYTADREYQPLCHPDSLLPVAVSFLSSLPQVT